jgi:YidC/Oxa1 family membrane protein insertase
VPLKIRNPNYQELGIEPLELSLRTQIGVVVAPSDIDSIPQTVEKLRSQTESYRQCIDELRKRHVYAFGHSSEIGAHCVINFLDRSVKE